jgi:hypothetical protein
MSGGRHAASGGGRTNLAIFKVKSGRQGIVEGAKLKHTYM